MSFGLFHSCAEKAKNKNLLNKTEDVAIVVMHNDSIYHFSTMEFNLGDGSKYQATDYENKNYFTLPTDENGDWYRI